MCINHYMKVKRSQLGKKAYAISNYDTELMTYCQSSVTAFSVLKIFIYFLPRLPTLCVLTHDDLRTLVSQNLHVERFGFFFFPVLLVDQVRQICKPPFFKQGEGLLCLKAYLIFLTTPIDLVKDAVFS